MGLGLGGYIFVVFLKPIVAEMGWSRAAFAGSGGPLLLAMALCSPLVGSFTARFGGRAVFAFGITVVSLALLGLSAMQSLWQFYLLGLLLGAGITGLGDIPAGAVVAQWFTRNRGLALGLVYVGSNIGGSVVPVLASELAALWSWRVALQILAVAGWLVIVPFALWAVRDRGGVGDPSPRADDAGELRESRRLDSLSLAEALRLPSFWILLVALFCFYFYYLGVNNHLVAFLSDSGFSDAAAARRFSAAVAVGIIGKIGMGLLADRVPIRLALVGNFALMTLGSCLLLAVGDRPALLPVFLGVHGLTVAAENVLLPLVVAECFGVRHLARIYGVIMLMLLPGGLAGPLFAGYVFDSIGSYRPAFATFAVLNALTVAALTRLRPLAAGGGRRSA